MYRLDLALPPHPVDRLFGVLSADEQARAVRFRLPLVASRFVVGRARLREVLAAVLGAEPAGLVFRAGPRGKPELSPPGPLRFNLSHSDDVALLALATGQDVGVDVERVRPERDHLGLARRFFAPGERAAVEAAPPEERPAVFMAVWTRKEAFVKGLGGGLTIPLARFEVSPEPGATDALRAVAWDATLRAAWTLVDLAPGLGWAGALAVRGRPRVVARRVLAPAPGRWRNDS